MVLICSPAPAASSVRSSLTAHTGTLMPQPGVWHVSPAHARALWVHVRGLPLAKCAAGPLSWGTGCWNAGLCGSLPFPSACCLPALLPLALLCSGHSQSAGVSLLLSRVKYFILHPLLYCLLGTLVTHNTIGFCADS